MSFFCSQTSSSFHGFKMKFKCFATACSISSAISHTPAHTHTHIHSHPHRLSFSHTYTHTHTHTLTKFQPLRDSLPDHPPPTTILDPSPCLCPSWPFLTRHILMVYAFICVLVVQEGRAMSVLFSPSPHAWDPGAPKTNTVSEG